MKVMMAGVRECWGCERIVQKGKGVREIKGKGKA